MKQIPILFLKPKRGKDSCQSVYFKANETNIASCLRSSHMTDFTSDGINGVLLEGGVELPKYRIRKLTPRECLRLQGFPDEYIDKILATVSNTQAYKQAGNAVTVSVARAIGERLMEIITEESGEEIENL